MNITLTKSSEKTQNLNSKIKSLSVFIAGVGAVGGTLIKLIRDLDHHKYKLNIIGVCDSKNIVWDPENAEIKTQLLHSEHELDWQELTDLLIHQNKEPLIFVDATGSKVAATQYVKLLSHGVHVATPSKQANTFDQSYFDKLSSFPARGVSLYKFETAVGAGLPVIKTIKGLVESGDEITKITGVVSGTMTYIFNQLQIGKNFSEIVRNAKEFGYSEPDPRDDLSGEDVARKFLILARTSGYNFERSDIEVESLIPEELKHLSLEKFLERLSDFDEFWKNRNSKALVNNKKLRYTGTFSTEGIKIGIQEVHADSPLGGLSGTDNLIQIHSKRYAESPIVIQGPGAGKEVTAAGVLSDILEIGRAV